jgi:hypothetical protein
VDLTAILGDFGPKDASNLGESMYIYIFIYCEIADVI